MVCKITHSYKDIKHEINKQSILCFAAQSAQIGSFKIKEAIFFFLRIFYQPKKMITLNENHNIGCM